MQAFPVQQVQRRLLSEEGFSLGKHEKAGNRKVLEYTGWGII